MQPALTDIGQVHDLVRGVVWTPQRMQAEVRHRAAVLRRLCAAGDNLFVIAHANSPSFLADLLAVWQAGGCAVCVNPALAAGELSNVVDFVDARAVLVDDEGQPAPGRVPVVCTAREPPMAAGPAPAVFNGTPDDAALILFTSGTTGDPKGVVHSHRSIRARLALNLAHIGAAVLRRSLCVLPTHFGHGLIGNCLTPLWAGGDLYLLHGAGVAGAQRVGSVINEHRISFMSSVPAFWKLVLKLSPPPAPGVLQQVHIGSAPLSAELWRGVIGWAGTERVANMYGTTETANWIGGALATEVVPEDGLLGRAWGGRVAVRADDGQLAAQGQGEILVQSPSLMTGYRRRPDLTRAVIGDEGWYSTGDVGTLDANGLLRMTGRNRDVINRGGIKIYPEELDLLFERHAQVQEACAFAIADASGIDAVGVAVRLRAGSAAGPRELIDWARQQVRPEAVPSRVFTVDDIPKTDRGKLRRGDVARHCLDGAAAGKAVAGGSA